MSTDPIAILQQEPRNEMRNIFNFNKIFLVVEYIINLML
jgi:hypothetical protein